MQFNNTKHWTLLQKILFRFFFVFLSLQVMTEAFLGIMFRDEGFKRWNMIAERFTKPCLWLNDHIFHFTYTISIYSSFTDSLHIIRDIAYLLTAVLACIIWTIIDRKKPGYNKLHYWFSRCLIILLSAPLFFYGIIKVFPIQMPPPSPLDLHKPFGDLSPFQLMWFTLGYGQPYQIFSGFFELIGVILILFRRTRIAGLLIIGAVLINVIMIDYTYRVGNILLTAIYMLLIVLFLLAPYVSGLFRFFFTQQPVALVYHGYIPQKNIKTKLFTLAAILFLGSSFSSNSMYAYDRYTKREALIQSYQYSLVKNYEADGDTLEPVENDTLRWRSWFERVRDGKRLVTITMMKPGTDKNYSIEQDSSKQILTLHPLNQKDSTALYFNYTKMDNTNWRLEGIVRQKNIKIELQKINPDTTMNLLKLKRSVIFLDDNL